jgi:hypothetical protein
LKNNNQKSENKIQKYAKPEKKTDVFPLTQATLIKNEFMTLIFVCVIFEQAFQKRMCAL